MHSGKALGPKRYYDGRYKRGWPALRALYLKRHPLCAECKKENIIRLATEVDHIVPIEKDPTRRLEWNNLQSMCKSCHSRKTASEQLKASKQ